MQSIVVAKPYSFVPPIYNNLLPRLLLMTVPKQLRNTWGVERVEFRNVERLTGSLKAGHGILLAANHSRPCDPLIVAALCRKVRQPIFTMASWHLFTQSRRKQLLLRACGAFSVYREGLDKAAIDAAVDILEHARRPLLIFPEGVISRHNDSLNDLMEGVSVITRTAAKRRAKATPPGKVVVHPLALRYVFKGDLEATLRPVLTEIETRLSWLPRDGQPLLDRIVLIGRALLTLKEVEYMGAPQPGTIAERISRLLNHLLTPIEQQRLGSGPQEGNVVARVKRLRAAIVPDLIKDDISDDDREARWHQLAVLYYAQQISFYPPDYIAGNAPPERLLETVERFEEDLTDTARIHRPMEAILTVGEAIEVSPARERAAPGQGDPLMTQIEQSLRHMLGIPAEPA